MLHTHVARASSCRLLRFATDDGALRAQPTPHPRGSRQATDRRTISTEGAARLAPRRASKSAVHVRRYPVQRTSLQRFGRERRNSSSIAHVYMCMKMCLVLLTLSLSLSKEHNPGPNELSPRAMTQKSRTGKGASAVAMSFTITKLSLLPRSDL